MELALALWPAKLLPSPTQLVPRPVSFAQAARCPAKGCLLRQAIPLLTFTATAAHGRPHGRRCPRGCTARRAQAQAKEADPWAVLGLRPGADRSEVRRAFRDKVRGAHPDVGGDPETFRCLKVAYSQAMDSFQADAPSVPLQRSRRAPPSSEEDVEHTPKKRSTSLEDFFQWRREQGPRREARRQEERKQRRRVQQAGSESRIPTQSRVWDERQKMKAALQEAKTPEARRAWLREFESDLLGQSFRAAQTEASGSEKRSEPAPDLHVGHRTVRSSSGNTRVPVYQDANGTRYYVSPLTSKRVKIP
eukprot:TRINITY_DN43107_c0_g1_i1.p1 TRINITY_DN43107_c0_g1~~TRINITY_DN43107_c0_g1_i1.p1  ORF type:complete len:305 (+),score=56.18 TRINITY_DN43107_c0_g1_i1:47-961(+)